MGANNHQWLANQLTAIQTGRKYWGLQLCTCDLNTVLGLVCTLMNS